MKVKIPIVLTAILTTVCIACGSGKGVDGGSAKAKREAQEIVSKQKAIDVWNYTVAVNKNQEVILWNTVVWNNTVEENARREEQERLRRLIAARAAAPKQAPATKVYAGAQAAPAPAPSANVGGSCGGATNGADRFIGAESGGNPNARNSSGAWGCYQIMPRTWSSSCSDLGSHGSAGTSEQAQCASRLPSSSWAATGG